MDFSAALANLEQAAGSSRGSGSGSSNENRRRPRGDDESQRRNPRPRHHYDRDRPFDALHRAGYRVEPFRRSPPPADLFARPFHVALLCICIDDLPYQDIWKAWTETGASHVSLLCHAKYPDKANDFVRQRLITKPPKLGRGNSYADPEYVCYHPEWGSVEITRAMISLLVAGMKIPNNLDDERFATQRFLLSNHEGTIPPVDKFVFISESCVPVTTLADCERHLFGTE